VFGGKGKKRFNTEDAEEAHRVRRGKRKRRAGLKDQRYIEELREVARDG
jgi:hypothetical protein